MGFSFPHQGLNPGPQQWKHGLLTTEPLGNSLSFSSWSGNFSRKVHSKISSSHAFLFFKDFLKSTIFKVFIEFGTLLLFFKKNFFFWPRGVWGISSPTKDWTCSPCIGWQSLSHIFLINLSNGHFPMSPVCVSLQVGGLIGRGEIKGK